jgi:hypothetical protein
MTASGSVNDFDETKKTSLRTSIAKVGRVDASAVTVTVAAASVLITATIAVPASTTAAAVQTSLSSTLGTAADASAALGVTVLSVPTIVVAEPPGSLQDEDSSSLEGASSDTAIAVVLTAGLIVMLAAGTYGAVVRYRKNRFKMQPRFLDVGLSVSPMYASNFPVEKVDQFAPL